MTRGVAADVAFLVNMVETTPERAGAQRAAGEGRTQSELPGVGPAGPAHHRAGACTSAPHINDILVATFERQLGETHAFTSRIVGDYLDLGGRREERHACAC